MNMNNEYRYGHCLPTMILLLSTFQCEIEREVYIYMHKVSMILFHYTPKMAKGLGHT